jgi:hypothetical protein
VLVGLLLVGGAAFALSSGDDDQDVASEGVTPSTVAPATSTTATTRRPTTTTSTTEAETTTTTAAPAEDPTATTTAPGPAPAPRPGPAPAPAPLPTVAVPTTAPREAHSVPFRVVRGDDTRVPAPFNVADAPRAIWSSSGPVSNIVVYGPNGAPIASGPSGSEPVCPTGWAGGTCDPPEGTYTYTIRYVVNGLELGTSVPLTITP